MEPDESDDDAAVRELLSKAMKRFKHAHRTSPEEVYDFAQGIRALEGIIAMRECRRNNPAAWPSLTPEHHPEAYGFKR